MLDERKLRLIVNNIPYKPLKILDIFSGDCKYAKWIQNHYEVELITAIDKKKHDSIWCKDVNFKQIEIDCNTDVRELSMDVGINAYNVILMFDALEHTPCYGKLIELAKRCITLDGVVLGSTIGIPLDKVDDAIYSDPEHLHLFTQVFVIRLFKKYGFEKVRVSQDHEMIFFTARIL
jgi:2-polyprenyl-3-methyl-5-hydroxy-6-metoxy-1,4-benzoquinol methylase